MEGFCQFYHFELGNASVWAGRFTPDRYVGSSGTSGQPPSGGAGAGGWAFADTGTGFESWDGIGNGGSAIDTSLSNGECTPGWAIVVDEVVVCDGS
jgi:hypothetical protein